VNTLCKLCDKKRARRYCPGVGGDICPVCCGTERENTIDCPLDCEHLQEARRHERPAIDKAEAGAENIPNRDIRVSEQFMRDHEREVLWLTQALARALESSRGVDMDAREALDALIQTYRTRESGLIYETRPQNPFAAAIQQALVQSIEELRKALTAEKGMETLRDSQILGVLVFLQRLEIQHNNGRRRGRAFFDFLRGYFPAPAAAGVTL
jgi:hypothetical protein